MGIVLRHRLRRTAIALASIALTAIAVSGCRGCSDEPDATEETVVLREPVDEPPTDDGEVPVDDYGDHAIDDDDGEPRRRRSRAEELKDPERLSRRSASRRVWRPSTRDLAYAGPASGDRRKAQALFEAMFDLRTPSRARLSDIRTAQRLARDVGLELESWSVDGDEFWALTEPDEMRRGAGTYIFRPTRRRRPVLLQAPHAYFELRTANIAADLFFGTGGGQFDALFTNSLHRYQSEPGERTPATDSAADVCHNPDHWFTFGTDAAAQQYRGTTVVQLHGFAEEVDELVSDVYAIVSGGLRHRATPLARAFTDELRARFGRGALLYPEDSDRLGGTTNEQALAILERRGSRFLHIELGRLFRERLVVSRPERVNFAEALRVAMSRGEERR